MSNIQRKNSKSPARRTPKALHRELVAATLKAGALAARVIDPSTVETAEWVRWKCRYGCDGCGSSLMCPPHSPAPDQTRKMLDGYTCGVLFEAPFGEAKGIAVAVERTLFLEGFYKAFGLGAGPCELCPACAFEKGCRHAEQARPAMEACGIDVFATVRRHGFTIDVVRGHSDRQHYFGLILVE
jgi:predicted metal-binding protein